MIANHVDENTATVNTQRFSYNLYILLLHYQYISYIVILYYLYIDYSRKFRLSWRQKITRITNLTNLYI